MTGEITKGLFASVPDEAGRFGVYGGKYVSETLMSALEELETLYRKLSVDPEFQELLRDVKRRWEGLVAWEETREDGV